MKRRDNKNGFTLIELLTSLALVGVFLVVLFSFITLETKLTEETEAQLCIEDEERYVSEFLFETLYPVEHIEVHGEGEEHPICDYDFSYIFNGCPILGSQGEKTIRFVHEGTQLQIWDICNGNPQIKKAIAYHVTDATCELIQSDHGDHKPLLHVTLEFEAGHMQKSYDLVLAMRNLS
jgi:prepilin-type N-terminal cleavage/methylation domain-containing protein